MSKIAVVVSGNLRNLVNASSSWTIPGDYFLVVDENIYQTRSLDPVSNSLDIIKENLANSHVKFNSVTVCVDNQLPDYVKHHPSINMVNKWKLAYYNLLPYNAKNNYEKVIVLRPDLYLYKKRPLAELIEMQLLDHYIYSTAPITLEPNRNVEIMNDVLLMMTVKTFGEFANEFSSYYLACYNETTPQGGGHEIHSLLAKFVRERGITVKEYLTTYWEFVILRDNSQNMFENGVLKAQHSFFDLQTKQQEWWQETYGTSSNNMW
jgi:hypothetical protein